MKIGPLTRPEAPSFVWSYPERGPGKPQRIQANIVVVAFCGCVERSPPSGATGTLFARSR